MTAGSKKSATNGNGVGDIPPASGAEAPNDRAEPRLLSLGAPNQSESTPYRYWIPVIVVALGVLSIAMLIGTNYIREQLMIQDVALVHSVGEIQTREATSHLWIEEYVSGDEVHLDAAWENQDRSAYLINAILEGGKVGEDRYTLKPLEDPALRKKALHIRDLVEEFREIAERRQRGYEQGLDVSIGSPIDTEYDELFMVMLTELRDLESGVSDLLDRAHAQSRTLFRTILIAWVAIVSLAVSGLWTRERRRLVAEAALRESEAQLLQSQKMEAVGRLAGGLAHDINNYLAAVTAQCELAKMKPEDPSRVSKRMDLVIETASKAAGLIRRLLAFSRRETVQPRVVNLNRVVDDLGSMLVRLIGEDVRFEADLQDELWNVKIDPSQLEQVIVNLTINAHEAMPTGGELVIATRNTTLDGGARSKDLPSGEYALLNITDSGTGIPEEIREHIFEPFVTTKDKATSSGLGLATVYGIVKLARGGIRVESEPDKGTSFFVYLPRSRERESEIISETAVGAVGGSQRILLVEDNEELRQSTQEALETLGYSVTAAEEGSAAIQIFKSSKHRFDLLITDIVMPGLNGREVAEQLREERPDLPVIFVSGYTDDVILRHGVRESDVNFLPKPFSIQTLARKITDVLSKEAS